MDENLTIGTPEAAVRSCVNVLARVFNCDEGRLAFYLDMYWQLRCRYEAEKSETLLSLLPSAPAHEPAREDIAAPGACAELASELQEEKKPSPAAAAAEEKRRIRNRLMESRSSITVPDIVKIANGNIQENQIRNIIETRPVPVAVYRILDAALDKLENK